MLEFLGGPVGWELGCLLGTFQINFSDFVIGGAMKGVESRVWKVSNGGAASCGKFGKMCSDIESIYYLANPK